VSVFLSSLAYLLGLGIVIFGAIRWQAGGVLLVGVGVLVLAGNAVARRRLYRRIASASLPLVANVPGSKAGAVLVPRIAAGVIALVSSVAFLLAAVFQLPWLVLAGVAGLFVAAYCIRFAASKS
jgi:hypothetical protein